MNIESLKENLDKDFKSNKVILLDGNWGIGKSTCVKKYIKNKEYIYLSLFGIKDAKELEDNVFLELKNISDRVAKVCQFYNAENIKTNSFKDELNNSIKDTLFIVLDDLEKKSDKLTYKELFGLISALNDITKTKIILITDTTRISLNNIEIFKSLKELIIDKTYIINNYSKESLKEIISNNKNIVKDEIINKEKFDNYLNSFLDKYKIKNLRTINKMITFMGDVLNRVDVSNLTKQDINTLVIICFGLVVEKCDNYISNKDNLIKIIVSEYLSNISYPIAREDLVELVNSLYEELNENTINKIAEYFIEVAKCKNEAKNPKLFYLSEEKIEKKINKFIKTSIIKYNNKLDLISWYNSLYEYYFYSKLIDKDNLFKYDEIINIMDEYIKQIKCSEITLFNITLKIQHENNIEEMMTIYKVLKDKLVYKYFTYYYENTNTTIENKVYDSKVIADLITFVLGPDFKNNKDFDTVISLLRSKNIFIPDLNNEIDNTIWEFTHEIWKGISTSDESQNKKKMLNLLIQVSNDLYQRTSLIGKYRISSLNEYYNVIQI